MPICAKHNCVGQINRSNLYYTVLVNLHANQDVVVVSSHIHGPLASRWPGNETIPHSMILQCSQQLSQCFTTYAPAHACKPNRVLLGTGWMPQCGRGCQCAHAQALAPRTELKCMAKYRYWLAVEDRTILCLLCWLMKAIVVSLCTKKLTTAVGFHSVFWSYQNALLKTWRA